MMDWISTTLLSGNSLAFLPVLLDAAIKGAALLGVAYLAVRLMWRASAALRHMVLFLAMLGLLALPTLSALLPQWEVLPRWLDVRTTSTEPLVASPEFSAPLAVPAPIASDALEVAPPPTAPAAIETVEVPAAEPAPRWSRGQLLDWVLPAWALGVLAALAPLILGRLSLWRRRRTAMRITDGPWVSLLEELSENLRLHRQVLLFRADRDTMPLAWGVVRPRIMLPAAESWSDERRRVVLLHELAHIQRWHCLAQLISHVACALHWFNPLAWVARRRMVSEREQACDDLVLSAGLKSSSYADHILKIASGLRAGWATGSAAIAMARPSKLEGRLLAILDSKRSRRALTRLTLAIALLAVASVVLPLGIIRPVAKAAEKAEEGATQKAKPASPWGAILADGVTVELVGVTNNFIGEARKRTFFATRKWWKPDGSSLTSRPYWQSGIFSNEDPAYEFALRVAGLEGCNSVINVPGGKSPTELRAPRTKLDTPLTSLRGFVVSGFEPGEAEVTIELGVATSRWETVETWVDLPWVRGDGNINTNSGVILAWPRQEGEAVETVVSHTYSDQATRLIVFDREGELRQGRVREKMTARGLMQSTYRFEDLNLNDLQRVEFQSRPYNWVEFKNVSLKPGQKTGVEVSVEGPETVSTPEPAERAKGQTNVFLPDVDHSAVMLDLASGEVIPIPEADKDANEHEIFLSIDRLGKGDLVYDAHALILVRRAAAKGATRDDTFPLERFSVKGPLPTRTEVTTREGRRFFITVTSADKEGCQLAYYEIPEAAQTTGSTPESAEKAQEPPWGEVSNGLQCRLLPLVQTVEVAQGTKPKDVTVYVNYELRNVSRKPIKFLPWDTPLGAFESESLRVTGPDGERPQYLLPMSERKPVRARNFITIDSGETLYGRCRVAHDLTKQGTYSIETRAASGDYWLKSYYGNDPNKIRQNPDNVWTGTLKSNTVTVNVVRPTTPTPEAVSFGPVIERHVLALVENKDCLLDLDTGKLFTPPSDHRGWFTISSNHVWARARGIDASFATTVDPQGHGLICVETLAIPVVNDAWNAQPTAVFSRLSNPGAWPEADKGASGERLDLMGHYLTTAVLRGGKDGGSATYLFKTHEGGMGILQIVGFTEDPKGVKTRYKVIQGPHTVQHSFDNDEGLDYKITDEGLAIDVQDGELRIWGTPTNTSWKGEAVFAPVEDRGGAVEASAKFRLAKREASGLVFLALVGEKAGHMILIFEWHGGGGSYYIQRRYLNIRGELVKGRRSIPAFGNEDAEFNLLRIRVQSNRKDVDFYANDVHIDTLRFDEEVGRIDRAQIEFETPRRQKEYDIRFDDLTVKADSPRTD